MKRFLMALLLISLGLNAGLGVRVWQNHKVRLEHEHKRTERHSGRERVSQEQPSEEMMKRKMNRRIEYIAGQLELDESQKEFFLKTHMTASGDFMAQLENVKNVKHRLREAARMPEMTTDDYRSLISEMGRQQASLDSLVTETMLLELEVLNEAQRQKYLEIMAMDRFGVRGGQQGQGRGRRQR